MKSITVETSQRTVRHTPRVRRARTPRRRSTRRAAPSFSLSRKIRAFERTWNRERTVQSVPPTLAVGGALLGIFVHRFFFALPIGVGVYLAQRPLRRWLPRILFVGRVLQRANNFRKRVRTSFRAAVTA
ncbi:MAG: hypothetical protein JO332_11460 [Planctomycetaceae bacterium]|nr:hypothetical protein [Planctomycetaceae bacterium]